MGFKKGVHFEMRPETRLVEEETIVYTKSEKEIMNSKEYKLLDDFLIAIEEQGICLEGNNFGIIEEQIKFAIKINKFSK